MRSSRDAVGASTEEGIARRRRRVRIRLQFALLRSCESSHDRNNWLFSGSLAAGARAADIMSLIQTAKMNQIEPLAYLTDVLTRLPTHPNSRIDELLPTRWRPVAGVQP